MNKNRKLAITYYVVALLWYIAAIFMKKGSSSVALPLCIGLTFLCLGSVHLNRSKKDEDKPENNGEDDDKPGKHE